MKTIAEIPSKMRGYLNNEEFWKLCFEFYYFIDGTPFGKLKTK